ncbi:MAG: hypothetical protein L6V93_23175 [Clostridiales bacterium]|nr:MAG: hypothetical protein L6V93_23175 [Clostridiales bacterium]
MGIKAPSLYKHFTGKKSDFFDAIIERVNNADAEYAGDYEMPSEPKKKTGMRNIKILIRKKLRNIQRRCFFIGRRKNFTVISDVC